MKHRFKVHSPGLEWWSMTYQYGVDACKPDNVRSGTMHPRVVCVVQGTPKAFLHAHTVPYHHHMPLLARPVARPAF